MSGLSPRRDSYGTVRSGSLGSSCWALSASRSSSPSRSAFGVGGRSVRKPAQRSPLPQGGPRGDTGRPMSQENVEIVRRMWEAFSTA
jgi:hypothetical protein